MVELLRRKSIKENIREMGPALVLLLATVDHINIYHRVYLQLWPDRLVEDPLALPPPFPSLNTSPSSSPEPVHAS